MKIRQALREQSPSLQLQRAAADEIARLDSLLLAVEDCVEMQDDTSAAAEAIVDRYREWKKEYQS